MQKQNQLDDLLAGYYTKANVASAQPDIKQEMQNLAAAIAQTEENSTASVQTTSVKPQVVEVGFDRNRRYIRLPLRVALASLLVLGSGTAVAAAAGAPWLSGFFSGSAGTEEVQHNSEYWWTDSPDIERGIRSIYPSYITVGNGYSKEDLISAEVKGLKKVHALAQPTGMIRSLEDSARCTWLGQWINQSDKGAVKEANLALEKYTKASVWPAIVKTDGGGVVASNRSVIPLMQEGNVSKVKALAPQICAQQWLTPKGVK